MLAFLQDFSGRMIPRNTRHGASATTRRSTTNGGARATTSARTPKTSAKRAVATTRSCDAPGNGWWVAPLVILLVVTVFVFTYYPVARVQYREARDLARLENEFAALEARNVRLSKEVERLRTPEGVEDYARTRLGLVKRGESIAVVQGLPESMQPSKAKRPRIDSDYTPTGSDDQWTALLDFVFQVQ